MLFNSNARINCSTMQLDCVLVYTFVVTVATKNFRKCNRQQPDWNECVFDATQHGLAELTRPYEEINIPNLNPYEVKEVTLSAGTGTSFSVNQVYKNCEMYGLIGAKLKKMRFDFEKGTLDLRGVFPKITITCDYEMTGKILLVPVSGKGTSNVTFKNVNSTSLLRFEELKKKGKTYLRFVSNELVMVPELVTFNYDNLFNGDKVLSDNTNNVLNENWHAVYDDSKHEFTEVANKIFLELLNNFFSKVSMEEACQYQMDGQVLFLPIRGEGPSTIVLENLKADCLLGYEEVKRDDKTHIRFVSSKLDIDPSLMSFEFENLFDASNFKKCDRQQPDLKKCVLEAAQDGVSQLTKPFPKLNLPSLDPIEVKEMLVTSAGRTKNFAVDQHYKNCQVFGLNKGEIYKFEFDFEKRTLDAGATFPEIVMNCDYSFKGQVLLVPINGEGRSSIRLRNSNSTGLLEYEEVKRRRRTYPKFVSIKLRSKPELVSFNFENLFNGDKAMSDNANKMLNDNWQELYEDVEADYKKVVEEILLALLNNFFAKVSLEEAFD
ncbi:uncharacterized protein BDFB_009197 [Asbolus verrucosus]|uniref:JHBP domain containing protein n=1 Tax=Asbolus verrucosus TaxID=1661398 RepID=A0A482VU91_ASBVE|nr:uncharacterized protein BDFB_009197 [Asbolus verrucosus]